MIDVKITLNEVKIAAFEHQLTNYSNPMTHSLKFKFKIWNFFQVSWSSKIQLYYVYVYANQVQTMSIEVEFVWNRPKDYISSSYHLQNIEVLDNILNFNLRNSHLLFLWKAKDEMTIQ